MVKRLPRGQAAHDHHTGEDGQSQMLTKPQERNEHPVSGLLWRHALLEAVVFPDVSVEFPLFRHGFGAAAGEFGRSVR
ncbi:hypothetical protein ACIGW8_36825, partial [Streptomyces sioyaensis]|uniref:hypothetical protein n=1 Tax=Streptomyces sioyaensis TaxID=67364 RepID=UPI0037D05567